MTRLTFPRGVHRPEGTLRGMWTREQRKYFLMSLATKKNPDQKRAEDLLARMIAQDLRKNLGR